VNLRKRRVEINIVLIKEMRIKSEGKSRKKFMND